MKLTCLLIIAALPSHVIAANEIRAGMTHKDVTEEMSRFGIIAEERHLSISIPAALKVAYFPLETGMDLVVTIHKKSQTVSHLSVTFYPEHRPAKGMDISKELNSFSLSEDGYILEIKKAPDQPMPTAVTPDAGASVAPSAGAAHL